MEAHERRQYQSDEERREEAELHEVHPEEEQYSEPERRAHRSRWVIYAIILLVVFGALAAGIWWAMATFGGPQQNAVVGAVDGYFRAGALNDREAAAAHIYVGEDAAALGGDDFSGPFEPEVFFAFREVRAQHYFAGEEGAYVYGFIEYNERPSREFTAVLRQREDGNWGLLRLDLSEPLAGGS